MAHLTGSERAHFVRGMFDRIAGRYDLMNRLMTFGQDRAWRRYVVRQAALKPGDSILDVATGTGDIAIEALMQAGGQLQAIGADFALGMMQVGQRRADAGSMRWVSADALALPFVAERFEAVTSGYLMRNVIDVPGAFREQMRVLRKGGRVVCLETSPPRGILSPFIVFYLKYVIPLLGRLVAGDSSAYEYLPESTRAFREAEELAQIMREAGFIDVRYRRFMFGTMAVHVGIKPGKD